MTQRRPHCHPVGMPARRPPNARRRKPGGIARLLLLVLLVVGFGFLASRSEATPAGVTDAPADGTVTAAERAVEALLDPRRSAEAVSALPADFAAVTGVEVATQRALDGTERAVHVGGGCSAPWGDDSTRWDFGTPCRSHDLGYDLLRYAERKGSPLDAGYREQLDDRLSEDMYATCDVNPRDTPELCRSVAAVYTAGLVVNSWHQRWGPPIGEPLSPLLAGVAVIAVLLWHRFRERLLDSPAEQPRRVARNRSEVVPAKPWTLLGVVSLAVLILGESTVALTRWAGVDGAWLWPLTWLTQAAVLFFFAAGHSNAATWEASARSGGGVRAYLAHRGSWLLRLTLVFAVVAFAVPLGLEVLSVPPATIEGVVRVALHPLWLLGFYLLTVVLTPLMWTAHRYAPRMVPLGLALALAAAEWASTLTTASWPHHLATLTLALLAQQAAFAHRDGFTPSRHQLLIAAGTGAGALTIGITTGVLPPSVLGVDGGNAPPALAGPTTAVLLIGVVQIAVLGLVRARLAPVACRPSVLRAAGLASRAPMSLYLLFLAAVLLLVGAVHLPQHFGQGFDFPSVQSRALLATALLAGPAVFVFVWIERHGWHGWHGPPPLPAWGPSQGRLDRLLSLGATTAGFGFAVLGVFGFALTTLDTEPEVLSGLLLDPVQSLVHLLLGMSLLHCVRTGSTSSPGIWLLAATACVPPLLSVTAQPVPDSVGVVVHVAACVAAVAAAATTTVTVLASPGRALRR
ncbi:phospholipase A2 [Saccharomonospora xinjiangensis]|nr:Prokaryotic phospholipase A2 [Saccharomonospora xinjiangensis]